jgi:hypothetical protein
MTARQCVIHHAAMRTSRTGSETIRGDSLSWPASALVDRTRERYSEWHEDAAAVADAYERWSAAPAAETELRFAAYVAALDQEATAASAYAESIVRLIRWLPPRH